MCHYHCPTRPNLFLINHKRVSPTFEKPLHLALIFVSLTENLSSSQRIVIAWPVKTDNVARAWVLEGRLWPVEGIFLDRRKPKKAIRAGGVGDSGYNSPLLGRVKQTGIDSYQRCRKQ